MKKSTFGVSMTQQQKIKNGIKLSAVLLMASQWSLAQQVIGSFPIMDGGFEAQTSATKVNATGTNSSTALSNWTYDSTSAPVTIQSTSVRSGNKAAEMITAATSSTSKYLQSPSIGTDGFAASTSYTVQFYYKATGGGTLKAGFYSGARNSGAGSVATADANGWIKQYWGTNSTSSTGVTAEWAGIASATASTTYDMDDFVVYAGGLDTTPPDAVTSAVTADPSTGTSLNILWNGPATGVDGGGYLVIRNTDASTNTPNVNGIYAVGNTIDTGIVVYLGTGDSFTDTGLTKDQTYTYQVLTVDKAFNYAPAAAVATGTPTATLGINSANLASSKVYSSGSKVFVSNLLGASEVKIYNMNGGLVKSVKASNDLSFDLKPGIYIVNVNSAKGNKATKVLVK